MYRFLFTLLIITISVADDRIGSLPGLKDQINFSQYAGFIPVTGQKKLFYWFVESQGNPATDPVLLWLQGGPGCSSLYGLFKELGPFVVTCPNSCNNNQEIHLNPWSWNKFSNIIFLEAPAGVGYSYSTNQSEYVTSDKITAEDNYIFLLNFFAKYSQFKTNKFYIAGESYAGIYIPTLVAKIQEGNQKSGQFINLVSFLVGNGLTDRVINSNTYPDFMYYHGYFSKDTYKGLLKYCDGNYYNPTNSCAPWIQKMLTEIGDVNMYDIYDPCPESSTKYSIVSKSDLPFANLRGATDCIDMTVETDYLNRLDVQQALHVSQQVGKVTWSMCSNKITYERSYATMLPFYPKILEDFTALIYSGDVDSVINFMGTDDWVSGLNKKKIFARRQWFVDNKIAGFIEGYDRIQVLTVLGAGHMVPYYKPVQGFEMAKRYLAGTPI